MNKELPPLHAQMQFPNLNLEEKQLVDVCYEHGVTTPRAWHMAAGYEPSPEMIQFAALIKDQMKALPDIRLTISKPNTVTGRLSQAAQFDGDTNGKIESVALMAWNHGMSYKDYCAYADAAQTTALNQPEYQAICNSWNDMGALVKECTHRIQVHGINEAYNKMLADAFTTGTGVISVHVDENDQILIKHWDSNILFNQRNHTE